MWHGLRTLRVKANEVLAVVGILVLLGAGASRAQVEPPAIEWERTYVRDGFQEPHCVLECPGGGYVTTGCANEGNGPKSYIQRVDEDGHELWFKTYVAGWGKWLEKTADGLYVMVGEGEGIWGSEDIFFIKIDPAGEVVCSSSLGGKDRDRPFCVKQTRDGGFVIAGITMSHAPGMNEWDAYLMKTDACGSQTGSAHFGGPCDDTAMSVLQTDDGGYVFAGKTTTPPCVGQDEDVLLSKLDSGGKLVWQQTWGGKDEPDWVSYGACLDRTPSGGYIVAAVKNTWGLGCPWLIATDADGKEEWSRTFEERFKWTRSVERTGDGGYMFSGDVFLMKIDGKGNELWRITEGAAAGGQVHQTADGGYIIFNGIKEGNRLVKLAPEAPPSTFQRGQTNDDGKLDLTDPVCLLGYLFGRADDPCKSVVPACLDAADANDDGKVGITDAIYILLHLFQGGPPLPGPTGECGPDPTLDALGCVSFEACG
jgi:hypothetical protein